MDARTQAFECLDGFWLDSVSFFTDLLAQSAHDPVLVHMKRQLGCSMLLLDFQQDVGENVVKCLRKSVDSDGLWFCGRRHAVASGVLKE